MPHTIEITCYADLEELIASIVKLVGEISGKEVCQRNADDLRQATVAIETMVAESAAIPPAPTYFSSQADNSDPCMKPIGLTTCGYPRYHLIHQDKSNMSYHEFVEVGPPPVQDHGPRVDTRSDLGMDKMKEEK